MKLHSLLAVLLLSGSAWCQTTWYVSDTAAGPGTGLPGDPYASIQVAISAPATISGDTILVAPGTYGERIDFSGKDVRIVGVGNANEVVLDGGAAGTVVTFASGEGAGAGLENVTVRNGVAAVGAPATRGGGIRIDGASPTFIRCEVTGNRAHIGGGLWIANGSPSFVECGITFNTAASGGVQDTSGAGVFVGVAANPQFTDCRIDRNGFGNSTANLYGGGVCGGGEYLRCTFFFNTAYSGAGVFADGRMPHLVDCFVRRNRSSSASGACGPGAGVRGPALCEDTVFLGNRGCIEGGGAYECTLIRCALNENEVRTDAATQALGGGASRCDLTECSLLENFVFGVTPVPGVSMGGGGTHGGTATDCLYLDNVVERGDGGGAYDTVLTRCRLESNRAEPVDAGIMTFGGGACLGSLTRCDVFGNRASRGGGCAGAAVVNCTVVENTATVSDGGISDGVAAGSVRNSIARENVPDQIGTTFFVPLAVTFSDVAGGWPGAGNFDADPIFVAPKTHDHHLKAGSPCIDVGDPMDLDPDGSRADVGAFPFDARWCGVAGTWCTGKENSLGCVPSLDVQGSTSLSGPDDLRIVATEFVNNVNGRVCWSTQPAETPFQGGTLCLGGSIQRGAVMPTGGNPSPLRDCSGSLRLDVTYAWLATRAIGPGTTLYFQFVARDAANLDGTGFSLSNAVEMTICP